MASARSFLGLLAVLLIQYRGISSEGFFKVKCKENTVAEYKLKSRLECVVELKENVPDFEIIDVEWKKGKESLLSYLETRSKGRFELAWDGKSMDVSLRITDVLTMDDGEYECIVKTNTGGGKAMVRLSVRAKYNTPKVLSVPKRIMPNTDVTLQCEANGGYPEGTIRWFDEHDSDWTKSSNLTTRVMAGGLFALSSELSLLRGSIFSKYRCAVFAASGEKEDEEEVTLSIYGNSEHGEEKDQDAQKPAQDMPTVNVTAPLVVIGSLIAGLLIVLLVLRYRRKTMCGREQRMPSKLEEGEVGKFCTDPNQNEFKE